MQKIAMISGISGQDGSYLAKFLFSKGYKVIGLYRRGATDSFQNLRYLGILDKITLLDFELLEFSNICRLLIDYKPDEFYNFAAQSFIPISWSEPIYTAQVDAMGVSYILEAIRQFSPKTKFYQASTSEMFGKVKEIPQNEETPFNPMSPYACAKLFSHSLVECYRDSFNIFASAGILFNHESPLRGKEFVTRKITDYFAKLSLGLIDEPLELGNLDAKRDWGFAGDYVEGVWLIMQQEKPDTYVLATGEAHSIREFVTSAAKYAGFEVEWKGSGINETGVDKISGKTLVVVNKNLFRPADVGILIGDSTKAEKFLGWKHKVSYESLCKMMVSADIVLNKNS